MHSRATRVAAIVTSIALLGFGTVAFLLAVTGSAEKIASNPINLQSSVPRRTRNLSLQPEAFKLSRRLGNRFTQSSESASTIVGTLATGGTERNVNITRRQTPTGEDVGIGMAGAAETLSWSDVDGPKAPGSSPGEERRILIERLVLDSPDQFILAQLRGASYYTVACNVRADVGGDENYNGPLWDVVRVDEPQGEHARRPLSNFRLYYINLETGLIDKIVSESKGETIEASILQWSEQSGEKFPSHIIWKRGIETVQEFRLSSVSTPPQQ